MTDTVTSGRNWPTPGLTDGSCGVLNYQMGFAIYKGYHLQTNLPSGDHLDLYGPGLYFCPLILSNIDSSVFARGSDSASINGSCGSNICMTNPMRSGGSFSGYWSSSIPFISKATFHTFSPGVYMVVGGDEWGDLLVLYFVVS